ncbi:hypothetical protein [Bartonella sp. DGB2]|uniref:hypothetical protein n=1 Tax=Bartonella sp. DGB2 TaxID=3388426 RepID=UPI00398FE1C0
MRRLDLNFNAEAAIKQQLSVGQAKSKIIDQLVKRSQLGIQAKTTKQRTLLGEEINTSVQLTAQWKERLDAKKGQPQ